MELSAPFVVKEEKIEGINDFSCLMKTEDENNVVLETLVKVEKPFFEYGPENMWMLECNESKPKSMEHSEKYYNFLVPNEEVKIEHTKFRNEDGKMLQIVYDDQRGKFEEVNIKMEGLEQNKTQYDTSFEPNEEAVIIETNKFRNEDEKITKTDYDGWKVKIEELEMKVEDLEQNETSMPPECSERVQYEDYVAPKEPKLFSGSKRHLLHHKSPEAIHMFNSDYDDKNLEKVTMFKCDQCDYKTLRKVKLKEHFLRHKNSEEDNIFKCDQCDFKSIYKHSLNSHLLRHKNPEEINMFKCDQCDFKTKYKTSLNQHLLRHKNPEVVNMFKCSQCDYKSVFKHNLCSHFLRHKSLEEVKMFKCNQCDYKSILKSGLNSHLLRHKS